jgi:hypothetical protein
LSFGIVDGKFQFTSVGHEDFIKGVEAKIKLMSKLKRKEFIRLALAEAIGGCNFIVFSPAGDKNIFLQFWTAEHQLKFHFYEGTWKTVFEDGKYKMLKSNIKEIEDPDWDWFYE